MDDTVLALILFLIIMAEVYYIFYHSPEIYEEYYFILIIIPATVGAYLFVIYSQRKISHLAKPNPLMSVDEYNRHVEQESRRQVD